MVRGELVKDWDNVAMKASNAVVAIPFESPLEPDAKTLAVWSTQPYQREFNCRAADISIKGWGAFAANPAIGIDLITGATFDVPFSVKDGEIQLDDLDLGSNPLIIKFNRR